MAGANPRGGRPKHEVAISRLETLVHDHGPEQGARLWIETLALREAREFCSPFALVTARRMARVLEEVRR